MPTELTKQQREDRAKHQYEDHEKALQKIEEFTSCGRVVEFEMEYRARIKGAAIHFAEQAIRAERERDSIKLQYEEYRKLAVESENKVIQQRDEMRLLLEEVSDCKMEGAVIRTLLSRIDAFLAPYKGESDVGQ